ncbi:hypothetical protein [Roseivirga misakiensis]|uniref:Uncharacterized protein n=1 Tax=Roseivirga misakiensis TaxID=1563681 RepID=A0A1E5SZI0_9BACT|nr:hypothetical protein [Roseivirga misakiensis]OEK04534.1 hypothetical protein BFP71_13790 [Roseivirga misakiensis]
MKDKLVAYLPSILSIFVAGLLTGNFMYNTDRSELAALEGLTFEEKYNYLMEGQVNSLNYDIFIGIILIGLIVGFHKLLKWGFTALFNELSKIRPAE